MSTSSPLPPPLTVIFLTFNSADVIAQVVDAVKPIAARILAIDSFSTDSTVAILTERGCEVLSHPFENYAAQRRWAQAQAALAPDAWVLHLDADEVVTPELATSIRAALAAPTADGYLMRRITHFLGKPIRYGHMNPNWHLRLYRAGKGQIEDRLYDQHFCCSGTTAQLKGVMLDLQLLSIERWTTTHNRWSTAEAEEIIAAEGIRTGQLNESLTGDPRERKRWMKNRLYYKAPLLFRAFLFFGYNYIFKRGFLDGKVGLIYHVLHAFWFRFLVDAKVAERRMQQTGRH